MLLFNDCGVIELGIAIADKGLCDQTIQSNKVLMLCQAQQLHSHVFMYPNSSFMHLYYLDVLYDCVHATK